MSEKKIGVVGASAIVMGNMMGSGISLLPASLASVGSITILSWIISIFGALCLAFVFSRLGLIDPKEGGPVAYAQSTSSILGHQTGVLYWLANWIGNLAIAITGIQYLSYFFSILKDPLIGGFCVILIVWIFSIINTFGASKIAKIVSVTIIFLLIPVVGTAIFGWIHFSKEQFIQNWNVTEASNSRAMFSGIVLTIWSFIGVESASVGAGIVKNPKVTIPLATMLGTVLTGLIYLSSTTVISGMFPAKEMVSSGAPFATAFGVIAGHWVEPLVAIFTAVACFASLGSWIMLVGQAGMVAARHGTLPAIFGKLNSKHVPAQGIIINAALMTIVMIFLIIHGRVNLESSTKMFNYVISTAVLVTVTPYIYSCMYLIQKDRIRVSLFIALIAAMFCFTAFIGSDKDELAGTVISCYACFLFYCFNKRNKRSPL